MGRGQTTLQNHEKQHFEFFLEEYLNKIQRLIVPYHRQQDSVYEQGISGTHGGHKFQTPFHFQIGSTIFPMSFGPFKLHLIHQWESFLSCTLMDSKSLFQ